MDFDRAVRARYRRINRTSSNGSRSPNFASDAGAAGTTTGAGAARRGGGGEGARHVCREITQFGRREARGGRTGIVVIVVETGRAGAVRCRRWRRWRHRGFVVVVVVDHRMRRDRNRQDT